ncbi:MAG TPA: methyl-accepting chemotaxis protein, partial [Rhodocyclaceae bacterium]|nr:methyl-accepting chemotaxis protein [Rhodocyclaceae bacterium]
ATLAVVLGATLWVGRAVFRQVGGEPSATAASLARIAAGDLTGEIRPRAGDCDSILAAASDMQAHLAGLVRSIGRGAVSMMQASEAIARNAESVADTAERQSQATSGIAAAVEELTVSIGVMSDNAVHAASLSGQTEGKVQDGLTQVSATTDTIRQVAEGMTAFAETMGELSSKVSGINGIVQAIHEIAEQTNLLALNAAIEAARAGEAGRGFAVVADEVRKLAEKSAHSASEIDAVTSRLGLQSEAVHEAVQVGLAHLGLPHDRLQRDGGHGARRDVPVQHRRQQRVPRVEARRDGLHHGADPLLRHQQLAVPRLRRLHRPGLRHLLPRARHAVLVLDLPRVLQRGLVRLRPEDEPGARRVAERGRERDPRLPLHRGGQAHLVLRPPPHRLRIARGGDRRR